MLSSQPRRTRVTITALFGACLLLTACSADYQPTPLPQGDTDLAVTQQDGVGSFEEGVNAGEFDASKGIAAVTESSLQGMSESWWRGYEYGFDRTTRIIESNREQEVVVQNAEQERTGVATAAFLDDRQFARVLRDPDSFAGEYIKVWGMITQFDSVTGSDKFRAQIANDYQQYWYSHGENAVITGTTRLFDDLINDDIFVATVRIISDFTYDSQAGNTVTAPLLEAVEISRQNVTGYAYTPGIGNLSQQFYSTTQIDLNLRSGPGCHEPIIVLMPKGSIVSLTGENYNGWYQVSYGNFFGWTSGKYIGMHNTTLCG